ncbi:MAG: RtcB family protein, partial [Deltaproteobacteria bacterium]|nr:RtcB family protein [Deltaproteobacteria bacterium]
MNIERLDDYRWEIPATGGMRVPGLVFADAELMKAISKDDSLRQVVNVAYLPGIIDRSLAMPDIHLGYGFPIGGVAAFDLEEGVISPGGVGYDINCGCRLMTSSLTVKDVQPYLTPLIERLYQDIPTGLGSKGPLKLKLKEIKRVLVHGASWAVQQGFGEPADLNHSEEGGAMEGADPEVLSKRALERGLAQLGTLGSGNHFLEVDRVDEIYDQKIAQTFGLFKDQVTILIHSGSRGLGYQVCDDFLKTMLQASAREGLDLPDRQLACAFIQSEPGKRYFAAMAAAANYAWANRQVIMHWTRESFQRTLGLGPRDLKMDLVYDVAHNIAKKERHMVGGKERLVCVHRKGATRSFPPGHQDVPSDYQQVGQPVLIPGDMGRSSFVLAGAPG